MWPVRFYVFINPSPEQPKQAISVVLHGGKRNQITALSPKAEGKIDGDRDKR
jgi:hypothetical protein